MMSQALAQTLPLLNTCSPWRPAEIRLCRSIVKQERASYFLGKTLRKLEAEVGKVWVRKHDRQYFVLDGLSLDCGHEETNDLNDLRILCNIQYDNEYFEIELNELLLHYWPVNVRTVRDIIHLIYNS